MPIAWSRLTKDDKAADKGAGKISAISMVTKVVSRTADVLMAAISDSANLDNTDKGEEMAKGNDKYGLHSRVSCCFAPSTDTMKVMPQKTVFIY